MKLFIKSQIEIHILRSCVWRQAFFLLLACLSSGVVIAGASDDVVCRKNLKGHSTTFVQFDLNIPGVTQEMLESSFWVSRIPDPDRIVMSPIEIERYNHRSLRECEMLKDLRIFRRVLPGKEVRDMIASVSARPTKTRYLTGKVVPDSYYDSLNRALNLDSIPESVVIRFGITVKRTEMRAFPSSDRVFSEPDDYEFDRFVETALYPVEPLAILHESADKKWFFVQAFNYRAWVPASDVALTDRKTLFSYLDTKDFLVVTGKGVFTGFNPFQPEISELQLDMGVRIPLASRDEIPAEICGQHPAGNYVVKLPARGKDGQLEWRLGLISRADDVRVGFLPLTKRNIIIQAFKFLGQRYGWGGMFNTRDCSAFIMDNFRSMGVMLPRNAGEQGKQALGVTYEIPENMDLDARKKLFDRLPPATPVYMSGHAMLYLWKYEKDYFIIHDFAGFSAPDESGKLIRSKTRGVLVTPLVATFLSTNKTYMEGLYAAREFRLE
ncbi:MAG: SH3 domain-containing protein [Candidatus Riflebacteria bacterium]|nr:SH3 domain-containing protein [Candidatus Riflebacteria bacterium]